ncbi:hypothetical protein OCL88_01060 [Paenarthrobacter sp. PAE-2]|uniref:hypothetical protein n=1 Tax=Paenarthrobacter sp. PAE-2 TaxID=2982532 RepID=UPI00222E1947|nr:hypothetical protein [Paenarthrobacter sp. PAE-2]MCW3765050.1 hypothetical protein [Paenarthrobacter sp. PAE-2]
MTATVVEYEVGTHVINSKLRAVPTHLPANSVLALVRGLTEALAFALVLSPEGGFLPGRGTTIDKPGIDGLPFPPTPANLRKAAGWPVHPIDVWWELEPEEKVRPLGYPNGATFTGHSVQVFFEKPANAIESASWLISVRRMGYGSPVEVDLVIAAVQAVPSFAATFLAYFLGGRAQKRKVLGEAAQLEQATRLAELQSPDKVRQLRAEITLAEAQALVARTEAGIKAAEADKLRLENVRNRLALLKEVEEYMANTPGAAGWNREQLWSFLESPNLVETLTSFQVFDPKFEVIDEDGSTSQY